MRHIEIFVRSEQGKFFRGRRVADGDAILSLQTKRQDIDRNKKTKSHHRGYGLRLINTGNKTGLCRDCSDF
jgi:hypothetical protein